MTDHSHIDERFRESQGDWESRPADTTWDHLADRLDDFETGRVQKRKTIFRWAAAASLAILMGLSFAMFNQSMDIAGFHAINADQEIPPHEGIYTPAATDQEVSQALTSKSRLPADEPSFKTRAERSSAPTETRSVIADTEVVQSAKTADLPETEKVLEEIQDEMLTEAEPAYIRPEEDSDLKPNRGVSAGSHQDSEGFTAGGESRAAGSADADEEVETEPDILTETAVANAIGIEQRKEDHKKRGKAKAIAKEYTEPAAVYEQKGDRAEGFVQTSLIILIPNEDPGRCTFTALLAKEDKFYVDRCQTDAFDLETTESLPLGQSILAELLAADVEGMRQIQKDNKECGGILPAIQFIYRYSTELSYFDEKISLNPDSGCLSPEALDIVVRLREFLKSLGQ